MTAVAPTKPPTARAQWHPALKIWTTGGSVIRFIETLCLLTNGRWTGERFVLLPWQRNLLYELFEVNAKTGLRRYRRALIGLPRKSGRAAPQPRLGSSFHHSEVALWVYPIASATCSFVTVILFPPVAQLPASVPLPVRWPSLPTAAFPVTRCAGRTTPGRQARVHHAGSRMPQ